MAADIVASAVTAMRAQRLLKCRIGARVEFDHDLAGIGQRLADFRRQRVKGGFPHVNGAKQVAQLAIAAHPATAQNIP